MKKSNKRSKKSLLVVTGIILIILLIVGISIYVSNMHNYEIEQISEYKYFKIYQNGKYGVIDKTGNTVIEPEHAMIIIPNPSKEIFICYSVYNETDKIYEAKVYNSNKEQLFNNYEQVLPFIFTEIATENPFEKSVLKTKQGDKYGIIDFTGKEIVKTIYESIESLPYKEGMFLIKESGKYGLMTMKGKIIVKPEYDSIIADGYYNNKSLYKKEGYIVSNKTEQGYRYGYLDAQGKKILNIEYNEIERVNSIDDEENSYIIGTKNGKVGVYKNKQLLIKHEYEDIQYNKVNNVFVVNKNNKLGVLDLQGKKILNVEYDDIQFSQNMIKAQKDENQIIYNKEGEEQEKLDYIDLIYTDNDNYIITIDKQGKYGVMNKQKEVIIQNNYQYIEYIFGEYFICTKDGKLGVVNSSGKYELDFQYNVIQRVQNKNILQAINNEQNTLEIYNKEMKKVYSIQNGSIYVKDNYVEVISNIDRQYFDNDGNIISNKDLFSNNVLFAVNKDGKWGFEDKSGEIKLEAIYDMATELNIYGFAGIKQNEKWGVIDKDGNIIVEPKYTIDLLQPEFISKYCKKNMGFGFEYYTDELIKE